MAIQSTYYIPNGPVNLKQIFPDLNFDEIEEYFIEVLDSDEDVIATTPINTISNCGSQERARVFFCNYCGTFDAVNFEKPRITHDVQSTEMIKSKGAVHNQQAAQLERQSVTSNDIKQARTVCYNEGAQVWLQELTDSPKAFEQWEGGQGQPPALMPIKILDGKFEKQKNDKEYIYPFTIEFKLANPFKTVRN